MKLADYWALAPGCPECGARCLPFHSLTPEHARLGIEPLGSYQSALCADCYRSGYLDRRRAQNRAWDRAHRRAA